MKDHTYQSPRGWILCPEERLCRLLETELSYLGISAVSLASFPSPAQEIAVILLDRDAFSVAAGLALAAACGCPLLSFGHTPAESPAEPGTLHLHRPFSLTHLETALRGLLEPRAPIDPTAPLPPTPKPPALSAADGRVTVGEHTVTLTPAEWSLLQRLLERPGETVPRAELATLLEGGGNSVDVYVCHLRRKIEKPLGRRIIWTVRGVGYRVELPQ